LIELELGISVLSAALRGEPTGQPQGWCGDVVAVAKRDLSAGEMLDGEGGYTAWGKLVPAERSLAEGALPIGLAHQAMTVAVVDRLVHHATIFEIQSRLPRYRDFCFGAYTAVFVARWCAAQRVEIVDGLSGAG
jgi:hypothetical protein